MPIEQIQTGLVLSNMINFPMLANIGLLLITFFFMEGVAWFTHKYIMHGPLWLLHKDHHHKRKGWFEMNDFFFLMFSIPSALLIMFGWEAADWRVFVGFGIAAYGVFYFLMHDVLVHNRLKWFKMPQNRYLRAIIRAHKMHHKHLQKEHGESFGFLFIHPKYFRKQ